MGHLHGRIIVWRIATVAVVAGAASAAFAGIVDPVESIEITNASDLANQNVDISNEVFIPGSQGGHFKIDTLEWDEAVGRDAGADLGSSHPREIAWWDVEIKVTRAAGVGGDVMISLDKDVTNNSGVRWLDFHMSVGTGVGSAFTATDGLIFKTAPEPINEIPVTGAGVQAFDNPAEMTPTDLWWFASQRPGLGDGETTAFWFAITVPDALFDANNMAVFTLREHASIPTPGAIATLLAAGGLGLTRRRRR